MQYISVYTVTEPEAACDGNDRAGPASRVVSVERSAGAWPHAPVRIHKRLLACLIQSQGEAVLGSPPYALYPR